jgi:glycosyltransferase involved in cell wall biosynthesis
VGTLARHKNLLGPVRAMAEAGWKVLVVGAGGPAKVFAHDGQLPMSATIPGRVSDEELAWCYDRAFALVFPSLYEGFGLPVVEAQSRGCPVVASQSRALPETGGTPGCSFTARFGRPPSLSRTTSRRARRAQSARIGRPAQP